MIIAMRESDSTIYDKLFLLSTICCRKSWCESFDDLQAPCPLLLGVVGLEAGYVPLDANSFDTGASGSSGDVAPAAGKGKGKGKGKSAAATKTKVRHSIGSYIKQSANMLHACARMLATPGLIQESRIMLLALKPLEDEQSECMRVVKGGDATRDYYIGLATYSWLKTLTNILATMGDMQALRRIGFSVEFEKKMLDEYALDGLEVAREDTLAKMHWRLCTRLIEQRAVAGMIYTSTYPYCMAPIAGDDAAKSSAALDRWRKDWDAFDHAQKTKHAAVLDLAPKNSLQGRAMADATRIARAHDFKKAPALETRTKAVFFFTFE